MQTAKFGNQIRAGPQAKMVGVAQNECRSQLLQVGWGQRFNRGLRPHRRKYRRGNVAVGGVDDPGAGVAVFVFGEEFKRESHNYVMLAM